MRFDDIKVEILTREESKILGPDDNFPATGDDRNQKLNQGCLGNVPQVQTGADIEKLHAQTSTSAFRRCGNPTMSYASGTWTLTKKEHERMIQSTQRKMLRPIIQTKRRHKKIVKRKDETNEKEDTEDLGSTGDESEDGQNSNTHNDQDSDNSFENDTDEEIDTTAIEEEEWVGYIRSKTKPWKRLRRLLEQDS